MINTAIFHHHPHNLSQHDANVVSDKNDGNLLHELGEIKSLADPSGINSRDPHQDGGGAAILKLLEDVGGASSQQSLSQDVGGASHSQEPPSHTDPEAPPIQDLGGRANKSPQQEAHDTTEHLHAHQE